MPTYDYKCSGCAHIFEAFQSMNDKHLTKCPKCGNKIKRLISAGTGIIFKGSGFYATDYKKSKGHSQEPEVSTCPKAKEGCKGCH